MERPAKWICLAAHDVDYEAWLPVPAGTMPTPRWAETVEHVAVQAAMHGSVRASLLVEVWPDILATYRRDGLVA